MGQIMLGADITSKSKNSKEISDGEYKTLLTKYGDLITAGSAKGTVNKPAGNKDTDYSPGTITNCKSSDDYLREIENGTCEEPEPLDAKDKNDGYTIPEKYRQRDLFKGKKKAEGRELHYEPTQEADVTEWAEYFQTPRTVDEIRQKIFDDYDNVCWTYMCTLQELPEAFIPELMALSTRLLTRSNYDEYKDKLIRAVLVFEGIEDGDIDLSELPVHHTQSINSQYMELGERLDWSALDQYQDLSPAFRRKFSKLLNNKPQSAVFL